MNVIKELWHGNIVPQEDSRTNSPQMKELLGYMARHHEDLEKKLHRRAKGNLRKVPRLLERVYEPRRSSHLRVWLQARSAIGDGVADRYTGDFIKKMKAKIAVEKKKAKQA